MTEGGDKYRSEETEKKTTAAMYAWT